MSLHMRDLMMSRLGELRYEPIDKRIRALIGDDTVVDSTRARLVWEPKRVVPEYAVPEEDVRAPVEPAPPADAGPVDAPTLAGRRVYDPSVPFGVRETPGEPLALHVDGRAIEAFRPDDPDLAGYVILHFQDFDAWYEEDERNLGHPRDPFHRIDVVRGSRHVRIEAGGVMLAESSRPMLLFEAPLPVRYYLPPDDVNFDALQPSDKTTICAYKGVATYWSAASEPDLAWTYREPLHDALDVRDHVAFFNERADIVVDGVALERPVTPWSRR